MNHHDASSPRMGASVRVLLVAGDPAEAEWIRVILEGSSSLSFDVVHVSRWEDLENLPEPKRIDILLIMPTLDDPDGFGHLERAELTFPESAVVIISDNPDESLAVKAVHCGAGGFVVKSEITTRLLVTTLASALGNHRTIRDLTIARERERHLGTHDQLTGLANRYLFHDRLNQATASALRSGQKLALLFIDLDEFKVVNDTLGHGVGDGLLRRVADNLRSNLRESDTAARVGGDEFAVLLTNLRDELDVARVAENILSMLRKPLILKNHSIQCSASIGIATVPQNGTEPKDLIKKADTAMYHAKKRGRNRFEFFNEDMNAAVMRRIMLETGLNKAANKDELILHYQPIFDLRLERITGAEALIRWRHPDLGFLAPLDFLALAEETGQIVQIGEWVLRTACQQNAEWQSQAEDPFRIAVNVSPRQLQEPGFAKLVKSVLDETGLLPELLDLEITETSLVQGADAALNALHSLKDLGVHLSIDDFGTGYSALSYLKHLPIDTLKIDQSFVRSLGSDPADSTIIESIVMMARGLNLATIAEGVETHDQLLLLASYGCNRMQGYLFGKPAVAEVFENNVTNPAFRWERH